MRITLCLPKMLSTQDMVDKEPIHVKNLKMIIWNLEGKMKKLNSIILTITISLTAVLKQLRIV